MEKFFKIFLFVIFICIMVVCISVAIEPTEYRETVVNETYEKVIPEFKWYSTMVIGNVQIPIENTNPSYTDYIICINGMPSYVTTDKTVFSKFHVGDKVKIGYKQTISGGFIETSITKE